MCGRLLDAAARLGRGRRRAAEGLFRPSAPRGLAALAVAAVAALTVLGAAAPELRATESEREREQQAFNERSLHFRTILHRDPLDGDALPRLVKLYEESDRIDELIGLYRSHIEQYPDDAGAKTVLVRILKAAGRSGEGELLATAVPQHPESAPLQYLLYLFLDERGDPGAVNALAAAIELTDEAAKRNQWLEELLKLGDDDRARALAEAYLERLLAEEGQPGDHWLALAKRLERYRYWDPALRAVVKAIGAGISGDESIDAEVLAARAEHETGRSEAAGTRLERLLSRLAPDHWRRREILSMRLGVVAGEEQRDAVLASLREAYEATPDSETAALDYAEALIASERRAEAARVLVASASVLPASLPIEAKALELLESVNDPEAFEAFLAERLELDPERADLRFQLVKINYRLRRDAAAEQEFRVVLAGLDREEAAAKLLELQRFLAAIERPGAAVSLLEDQVRNHPRGLAIARELAGIYVAADRAEEIPRLVRRLETAGSDPSELAELARFLIGREQAAVARLLLQSALGEMEVPDFPLSLLLVETAGIVGDAVATRDLIAEVRDQVDSPDRYRRWLETAAAAHRRLETLDRFFEEEERRYRFDDGEWDPLRLEQFLALCELARDRLPRDRVLSAVRAQLAAPGIEPALRTRLRRFLVGLLADDPGAYEEIDAQLQMLVAEDAGNRQDYDLQRALAAYRADRADLAKPLLVGIDFSRVSQAGLAADAVEVLVELGFLNEAAAALAAVNRLSPQDVFSWERRLTLLALLGEETAFRAVLRHWRSDGAPLPLSADSLAGLDRHLLASYWRSVSRRIASGEARQFEEVLPLLATVDRESAGGRAGAWSEWSRAIVLQTLGREAEAAEARDRLVALVEAVGGEGIAFPDGLTLSLKGARLFLDRAPVALREPAGFEADFLLPAPDLRWVFELEPGNRIEQVRRSGGRLLVLDRFRQMHAVDPGNGKLLWKRSFAERAAVARPSSPLWPGPPPRSPADPDALVPRVKLAERFAATGDRFFLLHAGRVEARSPEHGDLLWSEPLPFDVADEGLPNPGGTRPGVHFEAEEGRVVVFQPISGDVAGFDGEGGKLLWHRSLGSAAPEPGEDSGGSPSAEAGGLHSLNTGIDLGGGVALVYGWETAVLDVATGETLWDFTGGGGVSFPVALRRDRAERDRVDPAAISRALTGGAAAIDRPEDAAQPEESVVPGEGADRDAAGIAALGGLRAGGDRGAGVDLIDYLKGPPRRGVRPSAFLREGLGDSAEMLSSGAYWARARLRSGGAALGTVDGGYLWLMQDQRVRRVSVRFPVAARELPARGVYLGRSGQHLWFLDGGTLLHLDFLYDRVSAIDVSPVRGRLGGRVRAVLAGNQILVSGDAGFRVVNAITGRVVGSSRWPEVLAEYLAGESPASGGAAAALPEGARSLWQGKVSLSLSGGPMHCVPMAETLGDGAYVGRFGERVLAGFGAPESEAEAEAEAAPAPESAP